MNLPYDDDPDVVAQAREERHAEYRSHFLRLHGHPSDPESIDPDDEENDEDDEDDEEDNRNRLRDEAHEALERIEAALRSIDSNRPVYGVARAIDMALYDLILVREKIDQLTRE